MTTKMEMKILEDRENLLLGRRELLVEFPGGAGKVSRREAMRMVAAQLGVEPEKVIPVRLEGTAGLPNLIARIYIYQDPRRAARHLPEHVFLRNLEKGERKRVLDEMRKARAARKQAAAKG
jgi:ribosomal protein S24E